MTHPLDPGHPDYEQMQDAGRAPSHHDPIRMDDRPRVDCDEDCGALVGPWTLQEYADALTHWKYHSVLVGCSHGC